MTNEEIFDRTIEPVMTNEEIIALALPHYYVRELVAGKQMWGINYQLGTLSESGKKVYCGTVAELIRAGLCADATVSVIDHNWSNLQPMQPQSQPAPFRPTR